MSIDKNAKDNKKSDHQKPKPAEHDHHNVFRFEFVWYTELNTQRSRSRGAWPTSLRNECSENIHRLSMLICGRSGSVEMSKVPRPVDGLFEIKMSPFRRAGHYR